MPDRAGGYRDVLFSGGSVLQMTAEEKQKQDWIEDEMCNALDAGLFTDENDPELKAHAERRWVRHCEDGPDEMVSRDLGVWDLARCDGGVR